MKVLVLILFSFSFAFSSSIRSHDEDWGYVNIRKDAYTFWWLYRAENSENLPLVLWLQGGPGGSGSGFGNFIEFGPLDLNLKPRNTTWLKKANLLFVDNPVGAGFSYVTNPNAYTRNVTQIADDLYTFFKEFLSKRPEFQENPFYITCESYGGKMTSAFGVRLIEGLKTGDIKFNFKGVALGDSWISPVDSVMTWGPYLYQYNLLDRNDYNKVMDISRQTVDAFNKGDFARSTDLWSQTETIISELTDNVNVYNVLQHNVQTPFASNSNNPIERLYQRHVGHYYQETLSELMNGEIRAKLKIIPVSVVWGSQSGDVFQYQSVDFMKPVVKYVDQLLAEGLKVVVFQGQLDMICDTAGAELWIRKLKWPYLNDYLQTRKVPLYVKSKGMDTQGFLKSYKNFSLYFIMNAGHMVPLDNGEMALEMLSQIVSE